MFLLPGLLDRKKLQPTAALQRGGLAPFIDQETRETFEEIGTEPPALRVGGPQPVSFEQAGKKLLGQIARRFHILATDLGIALGFLHVPPLRGPWLPEARGFVIAGLLLQTAGLLLALWARGNLGRNWSARVETKVDHQLVRSGPYRLIRHPIYTGLTLFALGYSLIWTSMAALVATAALFVELDMKSRREERWLQEKFDGYGHYKMRVRRLIPFVY